LFKEEQSLRYGLTVGVFINGGLAKPSKIVPRFGTIGIYQSELFFQGVKRGVWTFYKIPTNKKLVPKSKRMRYLRGNWGFNFYRFFQEEGLKRLKKRLD